MADKKFTISGPGAADFIASTGGEDLPGSSPNKGMGQTRDERPTFTDPKNLEPAPADEDDGPQEKKPTM